MDTNNLPPTQPDVNAQNSGTPSANSGKNTLLALTSLLILGGVVGLTLFLYIQNKSTNVSSKKIATKPQTKEEKKLDSQLAAIPTLTQNQQDNEYKGIVCKRFTTIEEALKVPSIACELDLSNQGLTSLPEAISRLSKLTEINLSNNKFTELPQSLFSIKSLRVVNISDNDLKSLDPNILDLLPALESLKLNGNSSIDKNQVSYYENVDLQKRQEYKNKKFSTKTSK